LNPWSLVYLIAAASECVHETEQFYGNGNVLSGNQSGSKLELHNTCVDRKPVNRLGGTNYEKGQRGRLQTGVI